MADSEKRPLRTQLNPISRSLTIDPEDDPQLLTIDEVAQLLRLEKGKKGRQWVGHAVSRGVKAANGEIVKLVPFKLGRRNRFEKPAVRAFIDALRTASN